MIALWSRQALAVLRLEMRKTFFARRGLWIYLLAAAPVLLFAAHSFNEFRIREQRQDRVRRTGAPLSREKTSEISTGMTRDDVIARLGQPGREENYHRFIPEPGQRRRKRVSLDYLWYSDVNTDFIVRLQDGVVVGTGRRGGDNLNDDILAFAAVFQLFYLRLAVFFGCLGVFMNLFRGELLDKSLHFYFLAPLRREVVLAGKFAAGLVATLTIFTASTLLQLWAISWHIDANALRQYLWQGHGIAHVAAYVGVTALACVGYGSIFLAAGVFFRNPIVPAALALIWESANWFLPAALKKISVIFYLQSLSPIVTPAGMDVPAPLQLLASTASATPAALAIPGLILVALAALTVAALRLRRMEINYGAD